MWQWWKYYNIFHHTQLTESRVQVGLQGEREREKVEGKSKDYTFYINNKTKKKNITSFTKLLTFTMQIYALKLRVRVAYNKAKRFYLYIT